MVAFGGAQRRRRAHLGRNVLGASQSAHQRGGGAAPPVLGCFVLAVSLGWSPKLGLDLEGGLSVVYKPAQPGQKVSDATAPDRRQRS